MPSSALRSMAFREEIRPETAPPIPRKIPTTITQLPKENRLRSQRESSRHKTRGDAIEKPNCVSHARNLRFFMDNAPLLKNRAASRTHLEKKPIFSNIIQINYSIGKSTLQGLSITQIKNFVRLWIHCLYYM